jgi:cell division protein FtsI/penicillin-binding protein 2
MAKRLQAARLIALGVLLGVAFLGLAYRLLDLQVFNHEKFVREARRNTQKKGVLEPRRGDILDTKGNLLATSILVKRVCADPSLIDNRQADVARALSPFLHKSESELLQRLTQAARRNQKGEVTNRYVVLERKVPVETWQRIQTAMTNLVLASDSKKLTQAEKNFYDDLRTK